MAKFFNFTKEGPGVSKEQAMQKKTVFVLFETYFNNFGKLFTAGMLYVLMWIPLITNGFASVGITNIARNIYCGKHSFGASDFFETIKKNWKQALGIGILRLVAAALIFFSTYSYATNKGNFASIGLGVCIFIAFCFLCMQHYIPLLTIMFKLKVKKIIANSFKFVFLNVWKNLLVFVFDAVLAGIIVLTVFYGDSHGVALTIIGIIAVCFYPSFRALTVQFCVFPAVKKIMIDPYYEENPDADIELRRSLGLLEYDEQESVFEDTVSKEE